MKKSETTNIVIKLMTVYPSFKFGANSLTGEDTDLVEVVNIWHEMIGDMEYQDADKAVTACINKCKFVPSVAEIREEYDYLAAEKRRNNADIKEYYTRSCNSYPMEVPDGYGWEEWQSRVKDGEQAKVFNQVIKQYINECNEAGEDVIDFLQCVKTICRDSDKKIFFKEVE